MSSSPEVPAQVTTRVFVRGLVVKALIGIHPVEKRRRQPLVVDIELTIETGGWRHLTDTVDYETIAQSARAIAAAGHTGLVESYARRLADACLAEPRVIEARVRVEKPRALRPDAAGAGVEIVASKG
ncbi:MAG TPA: dihydroneopterin aldolase [Caulobacteraceae bacterium]|nr:dihydroneopterin aldolase [Caulobacteraceae bacterium]